MSSLCVARVDFYVGTKSTRSRPTHSISLRFSGFYSTRIYIFFKTEYALHACFLETSLRQATATSGSVLRAGLPSSGRVKALAGEQAMAAHIVTSRAAARLACNPWWSRTATRSARGLPFPGTEAVTTLRPWSFRRPSASGASRETAVNKRATKTDGELPWWMVDLASREAEGTPVGYSMTRSVFSPTAGARAAGGNRSHPLV